MPVTNAATQDQASPQVDSAVLIVDPASEFATPPSYTDGSRKRLRAYHAGAWWLNVNYVESESGHKAV